MIEDNEGTRLVKVPFLEEISKKTCAYKGIALC